MFSTEDFFDWASHGMISLLKTNIERKDVNTRDTRGKTLLHVAAEGGHIDVVKFLILKGADINAECDNRMTPLHWAAAYGQIEVAEFLVSNGAKLNATDTFGFTPLHHAIDSAHMTDGHVEVVKYLISKGADRHIKTDKGNTPLMLAEQNVRFHASKAEYADALARDREIIQCLSSGGGCYVATCVYGSYDCPEVWTLRRFRDGRLSNSWCGRVFIWVYYAVSPKAVELFGSKKWFKGMCKPVIDKIVRTLQNSGTDSGPYADI